MNYNLHVDSLLFLILKEQAYYGGVKLQYVCYIWLWKLNKNINSTIVTHEAIPYVFYES